MTGAQRRWILIGGGVAAAGAGALLYFGTRCRYEMHRFGDPPGSEVRLGSDLPSAYRAFERDPGGGTLMMYEICGFRKADNVHIVAVMNRQGVIRPPATGKYAGALPILT